MATRVNSKFVLFNGQLLTFPSGTGSNGQALTTDGSGGLSWSNIILGTIASGQVAYSNASNTITGSSSFKWDNTNTRLSLGPVSSPDAHLHIQGISNSRVFRITTIDHTTAGITGEINAAGQFTLSQNVVGQDVVIKTSAASAADTEALVINEDGITSIRKSLYVGNNGTTLGEIRVYDTDSSHYSGFKAAATTTSSGVYSLPAAIAAGTLTSDVSGNLSWNATAGSGVIGGTMVSVDPTHPEAADDGNKYTPFVTIQAAIDACPQYGTVLIAPGDYAENITLDADVALVGLTNQYVTGWNAGYVYNTGRIRLPNTSSGVYFLLQNLYLSNNTAATSTIQTDKTVHMNIVNCTVYNANTAAGSHVVYHTAGASSHFRAIQTEFSASGTNKDFRTDVQLNEQYFIRCLFGRSCIFNGNLTGENTAFSGESTQANGTSLFNDCRFYNYGGAGSFFDVTGGSSYTFSQCHFAGDCDYIVDSTTSVAVRVNSPTFGDQNSADTGFKGVAGSAILYRTDSYGEVLLNKVTGISGTAVATTNLLSTPSDTNYRMVITKAAVRIASATGLTGTLQCGIGVASGEDDIFESTTLTGMSAVDDIWVFIMDGKSKYVGTNSTIKFGVDSAFGGTVTLDVEIHGYVVKV